MKQAAFSFSALSALALCGVARADLTWEHKLSVRMGASQNARPIASLGLQTQWQSGAETGTAARHRLLVRASAKDFQNLPELPFGGMPGAMSDTPFGLSGGMSSPFAPKLTQDFAARMAAGAGGALLGALMPQPPLFDLILRDAASKAQGKPQARKAAGPVELVQVTDLEGDKFLSYFSARRTYLGGPLRPTLQRVRFNPWKKLAPRLSEEAPPALTVAQRERLGAEVRAVYRPFLKDVLKVYFRSLAETRTINGMEARGFRFVALANAGAGFAGYGKKSQEWAQVKAEVWVAPEQEGDAVIRSFNRQVGDLKRAVGGATTSMWANETGPVIWQMMPQEVMQVFETLVPPQGRSNEFFGGTPLLVHLTLTPPPVQRLAVGETRVDLTMVSRSTEAIAPEAFAAPANYKPEALEPLLKKYEKALDQYYTVFETNKPK